MSTGMKASVIGVTFTLALLACASWASSSGHADLARGLFWQNGLLQGLVPMGNIGTAQTPIHEGSPLNFIAFLASIPVGFVIYGAAAYSVLRIQRRST